MRVTDETIGFWFFGSSTETNLVVGGLLVLCTLGWFIGLVTFLLGWFIGFGYIIGFGFWFGRRYTVNGHGVRG